jgi:predicted RNA-binding Zn ribbon-like protein
VLPHALSTRPAASTKLVGGRLCLDYANLVGGWSAIGQPRDDRLTDYADLLAWASRAGLLADAAVARLWRAAQERPREAAAALERARRLRDAVHAIAWSVERRVAPRPADLQTLAAESRIARGRQQLAATAERLEWRFVDDPAALDSPLWPVAASAEAYFTNADLTRLHSCPGEGCGWHFEDATRNRSRQWCDMGDCGNVAKVRRFRSRQRARLRSGR